MCMYVCVWMGGLVRACVCMRERVRERRGVREREGGSERERRE